MAYSDPEAEKAYKRDWYQRNRAKTLERTKASNQRALERNTEYVRDIKESNPCTDCGEFYPYYVMDFDHLSDKEFNISRMVRSSHSIERLQSEIDKCELVCSNCHRTRSWNRMQ